LVALYDIWTVNGNLQSQGLQGMAVNQDFKLFTT